MKKIALIDLLINIKPNLERERAMAFILAGSIRVGDSIIRDPKLKVFKNSKIEIIQKRYLSRGGEKLKAAIDNFKIDCKDKIVLDAGASTGGFTDCLLKHGAKKVYAVDVGYNQLHPILRRNPHVVVMEKTNIKDVNELESRPDFIVADLSFRSLVPVLPHLISMTKERRIIGLLKPQFELKQNTYPEFDGVIRDFSLLKQIILDFKVECEKLNFIITNFIPSPILGGKGNQEYLVEIQDSTKQDIKALTKETILFIASLE